MFNLICIPYSFEYMGVILAGFKPATQFLVTILGGWGGHSVTLYRTGL